MSGADKVKDLVRMSDLLSFYGFSLGRRNKMLCPFHSEKTPSFHVYDNDTKFKCFGCGESGSTIDFVMKYFDLTFPQALVKINNDFNLNVLGNKKRSVPTRDMRLDQSHRKWKQEEKAKINKEIDLLTAHYRALGDILEVNPSRQIQERQNEIEQKIDLLMEVVR